MNQVKISTADIVLDADLALKGYLGDADWMFKTGVGGLLTAGSVLLTLFDPVHFLLFPGALALSGLCTGYILRTMRLRLTGDDKTLPSWNDWGDLFMSGITWIALQFGVWVGAFAIITSIIMLCWASAVKDSHGHTTLILECGLFSILGTLFWTHFLSTFLMVNFAGEEKLGAGFAFRKVIGQMRELPGAFFLAWALGSALQIFAWLLPAVTIVGIVFIPSISIAAQLIAASIYAQVWRSAELKKQERLAQKQAA